MKIHTIIRQITAAFLLTLFMLGNTPRQWLHDVFAMHKGCAASYKGFNKATTISVEKIHCDCNDTVIESPFIETVYTVLANKLFVYAQLIVPQLPLQASSFYQTITGRGPPSLV